MIGFVVNYFSVNSILTGSTIEQVQLSKHLETMEQLPFAFGIDNVLHRVRQVNE